MDFNYLAEQYETPAYLYDLDIVEESLISLKNSLPDSSIIYYSLKANPHPEIVRKLVSLGCNAEITSVGELKVILEKGINPNNCLYTGPGKSQKEIDFAVQNGITQFSIESFNELDKLLKASLVFQRKLKVIIRVNPEHSLSSSGLKMSGVASQFGIDEKLLYQISNEEMIRENIEVIGIHIFMGSNITSKEVLLSNFQTCILIAKRLAEYFSIDWKIIDLGGGFGSPYAKQENKIDLSGIKIALESYLDKHLTNWRKGTPQIAFESGRYLVGESGFLLTRVEDVKRSKDKKYIILDTGIHHISGMSGLGRIPRIQMDLLIDKKNQMTDLQYEIATVVGPLCTPLDFLVKDMILPDVVPGDHFIIPNVGAYGMTASLIGFLSREAPIEIVCEGDTIKSVTRICFTRKLEEEK